MLGWNHVALGRRFVAGAGLCALLALAACQTKLPVGQSAGASASGAAYLKQIRTSNGLTPLVSDPQLEKAALQQAGYMAGSGRMAHTTGRGKDFSTRMSGNGVAGPAAENIAHGGMGLEKLFSMWMNSQGHRRNMLDPRFHRFGLAYAGAANGRKYWALVVGK
ncbi:MAG: CAP domain-containing protein [Pseudaminobacter sp.]|nr:CAP domain-containing protein [Pseudaminobacter sp.]